MSTEQYSMAERIKALRKFYHLTQQQLANRIGVRKTTICNYESGYSSPSRDTIKNMMTMFNLPAGYFLSDKNVSLKLLQSLVGRVIPFYHNTNLVGLRYGDIRMMDCHLLLPEDDFSNRFEYAATRVPDNSMNKCKIKKNALVLIRRVPFPKSNDIIAAIKDEKLIIRRYLIEEEGPCLIAESTKIPAAFSKEGIPSENFIFLGTINKIMTDI